MRKGEIEQLGQEAQELAITLSVEGLANSAIADRLNEKYASQLNSEMVKAFLSRNRDKSFKIVKESKNFETKMAKHYFDSLNKMNTLCNEMWEFFYEIKKDPEFSSKQVFCPSCEHKFRVQQKSFGTFLKTAEHLLAQIKHVDAVLGKMQNKSLNVTYNYVDLSKKMVQIIPELFHDAEKKGLIKIKNKKKLKEITD